jgi:hypothetical protein
MVAIGPNRFTPAATATSIGTVPAQNTDMTAAARIGEPVPIAVATNAQSQPQGNSPVVRPIAVARARGSHAAVRWTRRASVDPHAPAVTNCFACDA